MLDQQLAQAVQLTELEGRGGAHDPMQTPAAVEIALQRQCQIVELQRRKWSARQQPGVEINPQSRPPDAEPLIALSNREAGKIKQRAIALPARIQRRDRHWPANALTDPRRYRLRIALQ